MAKKARDRVEELYRQIQKARAVDLTARAIGDLLGELYGECLAVLSSCKRTPLTTAIPGKTYFAFENAEGKISRAVRGELYQPDVRAWDRLIGAVRSGKYSGLTEDVLTQTIYSAAVSFCTVIDLTRRADKKTPGTYFEYLIGHLFASRLGVNPSNRLPIFNLDMNGTLPTDFVFDLGGGKPKYHLPIKTSTRERVIQIWAHQRVLDGVYGTGRFLGTPVVMAETKNDQQTREVVEICSPLQWRLYQMHIAQLKRVYYLDIPAAYSALTTVFPPVHVAPFGRFFLEADKLAKT
jgi:hypothetical protein